MLFQLHKGCKVKPVYNVQKCSVAGLIDDFLDKYHSHPPVTFTVLLIVLFELGLCNKCEGLQITVCVN